MDRADQPEIVCKSVFLAEARFKPKGIVSSVELNGEYELEFEFGFRYPNDSSLENYITVKCVNKKNPDAIDIFVRVMGQFEGKKDQLEMFSDNCFAILMPFLRSHVATITALGPMNPILLPVMNVTQQALIKRHSETADQKALTEPSKSD